MAAELREANDKTLPRELHRAIRTAGKQTLEDLRQSALSIKTTGIRKASKRPFTRTVAAKGTREKIAKAVTLEVNLSGDNPRVRFRVPVNKLPENIRQMPRKFDDPQNFRHPVMGNRDVWVSQTSSPWFWQPIKDNIKTFRAEIEKALEVVRAKLEK